jgi:hypothetical protein
MCFTCRGAYGRLAKCYDGLTLTDVSTSGALASVKPFTSSKFRSFAGWIGETYSAAKRYDTAQCHSCALPMDKPMNDDTIHRELPGMDCRAAPVTMARSELEAIGVPCDKEITGVEYGGADQELRPVVFWFDGTKTFGEVLQCAMNLFGGVPPILHDADDFVQERLAAIKKYNCDSANTVKLVPFFAGHSMGSLFLRYDKDRPPVYGSMRYPVVRFTTKAG